MTILVVDSARNLLLVPALSTAVNARETISSLPSDMETPTCMLLKERLAAALAQLYGDDTSADPRLVRGERHAASYQCNIARGVAPQLGERPEVIAATIVGALDVSDIC